MRFRKYLLKLVIWSRLRSARRQITRLRQTLTVADRKHAKKVEELTDFYENQLATERKRFELMLIGMTDRILQKQDLLPVSLATVDLNDKVAPHLKKKPEKSDEVDLLTFDQQQYFKDLKNNFWNEGLEQNIPESEIYQRWTNGVE